jgi:ubiquinone/menaquinone biosynthesis C-methylase UbiE
MCTIPKPEPAEFRAIQTSTAWSYTLEAFTRWCNPRPGECVLDIGCGPGKLPALFSQQGCRATGIDLDETMFRPAPLYPQVVCGDGLILPFPANTFNLVTASNLLFYMDSPVAALLEMLRVITSGGRIGLINPSPRLNASDATIMVERHHLEGAARDSLISWAQRAENHQRWSPEELTQICEAAGLMLTDWEYNVGPGFALFALAQKIDR